MLFYPFCYYLFEWNLYIFFNLFKRLNDNEIKPKPLKFEKKFRHALSMKINTFRFYICMNIFQFSDFFIFILDMFYMIIILLNGIYFMEKLLFPVTKIPFIL